MLEKKKLRELSKNLISNPDDYMNTFRDNVRMYIDQKEITIAEVAELADVPESTLKSFIYGKSQDCNLSTAVKLSRVFDLSVDEMVGCGTIVPQTCESLQIMRTLPESFTHFVRWAIHYHKDMLESNKVIKHAVEIMNAEEADDGNLKMTNNFDIIDISGVNQDLFPKIFMGIRIPSNRFAPKYFEGEIILLANDRDARSSEPVVVSTNENLWIFNRKEENIAGAKKVNYYSIRDGKIRATDEQIPVVIGYVAKVLHEGRD